MAGIEFASDGTRRAYHVRPQRPTDLFPGTHESIRVPAEDMIHVFRSLGPGQVRGVSALTPVLTILSEYDQASDALLVGLKVAAMHVAFSTDVNGTAASAYDAAGLDEEGLSPGTVYRLGIGEDVRFNSPDQAKASAALLKTMRQKIAAGLGGPTHLPDGDLSDAKYSSLRAGLTSRRQAVALMGWNVAELDAEIAADRARERKLGLSFSTGGEDAA
ncbi:phage portal protein [Roseisalinus antarcticus]|uniref:Phage portal protein, lambda family n=1 Tax=Roseisalinus antarcticus TaxID=254357 RepID=A0A1Y5TZG3_9RHOB|nr:phage portal protein [Roseisalinus antarcticus]SLN77514.1 Phage portal protein, lambda family [Roseisalinus antarcticus]